MKFILDEEVIVAVSLYVRFVKYKLFLSTGKIIVNLFVVDQFYRSLGVKTSHMPGLPRCKNL